MESDGGDRVQAGRPEGDTLYHHHFRKFPALLVAVWIKSRHLGGKKGGDPSLGL